MYTSITCHCSYANYAKCVMVPVEITAIHKSVCVHACYCYCIHVAVYTCACCTNVSVCIHVHVYIYIYMYVTVNICHCFNVFAHITENLFVCIHIMF